MGEINKVYKAYGTSTGHIYLTILNSSLIATNDLQKEDPHVDLAAIKRGIDQYIIKEYGSGMRDSYNSFAMDNSSNTKLVMELEKDRSLFTSKAIIDAVRQAVVGKEESVTKQSNQTVNAAESKKETKILNQNPETHKETTNDQDGKQKAIGALKSAVFKNPYGLTGWNLLGDAYKEMGDSINAKRCYDKALALEKGELKDQHVEAKAASPVKTKPVTQKPQSISIPASINKTSNDEGYYFENETEFLLYVKYSGGKKNITWLSGDKYLNEFKKGYQLFDQQQYQKAIDTYKNALQMNPVGVVVRMEMCSAYCKLGNLGEARKILDSTLPYLYSDVLIAKYYRLLGFILVEDQKYRLAAHCYQYSCYFGEHPTVKGELKYIAQKSDNSILIEIKNRSKTEELFREAGIKVITKSVLDEIEDEKIPDANKKTKGSVLECKGKLIEKGTFKGHKTASIQIEIKNTGDEAFPGNVELLYPDLTKVANFKEEPIAAGSSKNWKGIWIITEEESEAGTFEFFIRYPAKKANGNEITTKTKKIYFKI